MSVSHNFKYLIARLAFEDPARFLSAFASEDGSDYLYKLWNGMQQRAQGEAFAPSAELGVELVGRVLVLRLPPTLERGAALAVGVTGGDKGLRVFALERGNPDAPEPGEVFVAELLEDGRANFGILAEGPSIPAFASKVAAVVES